MPRDYKREYDRQKEKDKIIACHVPPQLAEDFTAKCELNNTTKNALIKKWIEKFTYGEK